MKIEKFKKHKISNSQTIKGGKLSSSGTPGGGVNFQIRGASSINGDNRPLF